MKLWEKFNALETKWKVAIVFGVLVLIGMIAGA